MKLKSKLMDEMAMGRVIRRISHEIIERNRGVENLLLLGIERRGLPLAEMIKKNIAMVEGTDVPCAGIDINFYRDDLTKADSSPVVRHPELPYVVDGKTVIIVDDVLYTGRTIRAAIDSLFAQGRPGCVQLAVLIDRGHRELPIRADFVGKNVPTSHSEQVEVKLPPVDSEYAVYIMDLKDD